MEEWLSFEGWNLRKDSYDLEVCNGMFMVRRMKDRRMVMI